MPTDLPGPDAPHALSRRRFLALAAGAGVVGAAGVALGPSLLGALERSAAHPAFEVGRRVRATSRPAAAASLPSPRPSPRTLVVVTLYGGNDGLNTVVPYTDPAYAAARGALALDPSSLLVLGEGFALHPSLPQLQGLWTEGHLAIVHGVGFADPNYSHFESMDIWQAGSTDAATTTGWIGRWLDATNASPLQAVGIGPTLAPALAGAKVEGVALPPGAIVLPGDATDQHAYATMATATPAEPPLLAEVAASGADLLLVERTLGPTLAATASADPLGIAGADAASLTGSRASALAIANGGGGLSAGNVLATQLSIVANLILAGAPVDVYSVELGGFDTHADQLGTQQTLLTELDAALPAFVHAIADDPIGKETVVLVFTEFGRRVQANASLGTDHGWANVAFVAGPSVKGGFAGEPPSLSALSEGNTVYTTDFRTLYASMFDQVLGVDPASFLGGSFPTITFV